MTVELQCANCGQPFYCHPSDAERGRKYCSLTCRSRHRSNRELPPASRTPVNFTCKECSKPFVMMQAYLTAYRKKFGRDPLYCSQNCSNTGRRKDADERNRFKCLQCGKEEIRNRSGGRRIYREQKYCSYECKVAAQMQRAKERFDSGGYKKHVKRGGYVWVYIPTLTDGGRRYILEHRHIMERHLGRKLLPEETVHHRDGNRANNALGNLELFSSRHGPGQRVVDKVQFAIDMLRLYPEFGRAAGCELRELPHPTDAPASV